MALGALTLATVAGAPATLAPNIVLICMDDMGYGDLVANGATGFQTPNLDRLAAEGMRFTQFLAAHPICSASRAALLTGKYGHRVGITGALLPGSEMGLPAGESTLAEVLRDRGYQTMMVGKWHLGDRPEFMPLQHGFDDFFGLPYSNDMWRRDWDGSPYRPPATPHAVREKFPETIPLYHGTEVVRELGDMSEQASLTAWFTERAVGFIGRTQGQPFFLYLAHAMPHFPLAVSERFRGRSAQGLYGDVMMEIDWSVGEILRALERAGVQDRTLVIVTSDNGAETIFGDHGGSSGGLRGSKVTVWEGGHRVPCLMRWPAAIPAATVCNQLASTLDLLPTVAELTGTPVATAGLDGVSLASLLRGDLAAEPRREFIYYFGDGRPKAVRRGPWKLVLPHSARVVIAPGTGGLPGRARPEQFPQALYNLLQDPGETLDVQAEHPAIVAELAAIAREANR